jgi:hypothetical protein
VTPSAPIRRGTPVRSERSERLATGPWRRWDRSALVSTVPCSRCSRMQLPGPTAGLGEAIDAIEPVALAPEWEPGGRGDPDQRLASAWHNGDQCGHVAAARSLGRSKRGQPPCAPPRRHADQEHAGGHQWSALACSGSGRSGRHSPGSSSRWATTGRVRRHQPVARVACPGHQPPSHRVRHPDPRDTGRPLTRRPV